MLHAHYVDIYVILYAYQLTLCTFFTPPYTLTYTPHILGQRASDFEEIALKRLEKIQALEAQLRQHVYALHQPGNTGIIMFIVLYVMYF